MNESPHSENAPMTREELLSALFAQMVIQQSNMAMMLLGKAPHPQTGQLVQDFEAAKMFIDQLEMLEAKTKGNLSKDEGQLLTQSLTALRMAFVEAVGPAPQETPEQKSPARPAEQAPARTENEIPAQPAQPAPSAEEESRKKFSKKY
jgi:uncharacterized protein DUF1844